MDDVRAGKINSHKELADRINTEVYYQSDHFTTLSDGRHYQAVSIKRLSSGSFPATDAPLEIRFTAGQKDFRLVLLMYRLMLKRIAYLKKRGRFSNLRRDFPTSPAQMGLEQRLSRFYVWVTEMGEDFETYRPLILDSDTANEDLDFFVTGEFDPFWVPDWSNAWAMITIARYIPDLEISQWVRSRMAEILSDLKTPSQIREELVKKIRERQTRNDIPAENKQLLTDWLAAF